MIFEKNLSLKLASSVFGSFHTIPNPESEGGESLMLEHPHRTAPRSNGSGVPQPFDDPTWKFVIYGSSSIIMITTVALQILACPPIRILQLAAIGFFAGFLAKKTINRYSFTHSIARSALTFDHRVPYAKALGFTIACLASFIFPLISAVFAFCLGLYSGYLFRHRRYART